MQRYPRHAHVRLPAASLSEVERCGARRSLKHTGRVGLDRCAPIGLRCPANLLEALLVQGSINPIAARVLRSRYVRLSSNNVRRHMASSHYGRRAIVATGGQDHRKHAAQLMGGVFNCEPIRRASGCLHIVGCWLLGAYSPVLSACTLFVASQRAGQWCVRVCGCVRLFAAVCRCPCCWCLLVL